ncbi:MAG: cellulase family glycosylhydrolase, partial [Spirochaetia bacterium]|nr:cellulase family glycosylhydrolase [Spirochaetia bacterium]
MKLFFYLSWMAAALLGAEARSPVLAGGVDISKWRGFNLMEHYNVGKEKPFLESDFKTIAKEGFNFVRLPLDYRIYEASNEPGKYLEEGLKELDRALALGAKYKLHLCFNLHKAPGYCINQGPTTAGFNDQLWTNAEVQNQFVNTWVMFAKRYRSSPAEALSFNLLNEPSRVDASNFIPLMKRVVAAIHEVDPKRLIVMDGLNVGTVPLEDLYRLPNVVTAIRGYSPDKLTHYKAEWVKGSENFSVPEWPVSPKAPGYLFGPQKSEMPRSPLIFKGSFPEGTEVEFTVEQVSRRALLLVQSDGSFLFEKDFVPGPGVGEWKEVIFKNGMYQNNYARAFGFTLNTSANSLSVQVTNGDWLKVSRWRFRFPGGAEFVLVTDLSWGRPPTTMTLENGQFVGPPDYDGEFSIKNQLAPWKIALTNGAKVFVGEMGVYKYTPHEVTLRWFESSLREYAAMNIGWALWNYRGSMGVADSGRGDVQYEDWDG